LPEAAMIAGLFQAPDAYDPYSRPELADERKNIVLSLMKRHGYISEKEYKLAKEMKVDTLLVGNSYSLNKYQGFVDTVVEEVIDRTGNDPATTSMTIYTTLDPERQDVIEGIYPDNPIPPRNQTLQSQIKKVLRVYPEHPGIINFVLYGNHDYHSLQEDGIDVSRIFETKRYDLVSLGYGESTILLKDDAISIVHDLKKSQTVLNPDTAITFKGHSHKSKNSFKEEKKIFIPTLSDDTTGPYEFRPLPCFLEAEFFFYDKKIERINLRQLAIVNKEIRLANEEAIVLRKVPRTKRSYIPSQK
jgi:hypothetical protein